VKTGEGGAIYANAPIKIQESRFAYNLALGKFGGGGAVSLLFGADYDISHSSFIGNQASQFGGAVQVSNPTFGTLSNNSFLYNVAKNGGSAVSYWQNSATAPIDPSLPFGADYQTLLLNNTFHHNTGKSQLHFWDSPDEAETMLFVNNLIWGEPGTAACSGDLDRLAVNRVNDGSGKAFNRQTVQGGCTNIPEAEVSPLGNAAVGWYFGQSYAKTILEQSGDPVVCDHLAYLDQFKTKRVCKMGAVENDPPPVKSPLVPWS
jgi:hypothetical protein